MTHPGAIVQCALEGCEGTWEYGRNTRLKRFCSHTCGTTQQNRERAAVRVPIVRMCEYTECGKPFTVKYPGARTRCCSRSHGALQHRAAHPTKGEGVAAHSTCRHCGKGLPGHPPKAADMPRYCNAACKDADAVHAVPRGDVPRRDPYCTTCSMCGRVARYLSLTDAELRAMPPEPHCEHCGGATWVEPFETTAHRVGDVAAGRTARAVAGWNYRESVGEMAG